MTTIKQVRDAMATAVETTGLSCKAHTVNHVDPPVAMIETRPFDPRLNMSQSKWVVPFVVRVFAASLSEMEEAQRFDEYRELSGSTSVLAAIQTSGNWGITVDYAQVTQIGEPQWVDVGGIPYQAVDFDVEVCW